MHPELQGDDAARWGGLEFQKASQWWLMCFPISAVMAKVPDSLHCRPLPLSRVATSCLQVDSIIPEPIPYPFSRYST